MHQVVVDTNVLVAALRSKRGASHRLISQLGDRRWQPVLSVTLVLEYEAAATRACETLGIPSSVASDIIDMICAVGRQSPVRFRWRPVLPDPGDDFVLELAVAAGCDVILTFNQKDFEGAEAFGIRCLTPAQFLEIIEESDE